MFRKIATETAEAVMKMATNKDEWIKYKTTKNVEVSYKKSCFFQGNAWKFKTLIEAPFDTVWQLIKPSTATKKADWDKSVSTYSCIRNISDDIIVSRITTNAAVMGAVASREFITLFHTKHDSNPAPQIDQDYGKTSWVFARSVEDAAFPVVSSPVRATNYPTGYLVAESISKPESCYVELYVNTDIGGLLPQSLVEIALPGQQIQYLKTIAKQAKLSKEPTLPEK